MMGSEARDLCKSDIANHSGPTLVKVI